MPNDMLTLQVAVATILVTAAVASLSAAMLLRLDKRAAERGGRRVPERTLHLLELAGGWPGSLVARRLLRHKTVKPRYRIVASLAALAHLAAAAIAIAIAAR